MEGIPAELLAQVATDPEAVALEPPVEEPAAAPEPEAAPAPAKAEEPDEDAATLEDIKSLMGEVLNDFVKEQNKQPAAAPDDADDDATDESAEVVALRAKVAELEQKEADALVEAEAKKIEHEVASTIGKLHMTQEQVDAAVAYANRNPDIVGLWSFEQIARRANPELEGRPAVEPKPGPPAPAESSKVPLGTTRAAGVIVNGANGPSAPAPFKASSRPRDYSDITAHVMASGLARELFTRT